MLEDDAADGDPAALALDVLGLLLEDGVLGVVAAGAGAAGADVEAGLVLVASEEAGVFALSVPGAAALSDVSLPPGFILSE
ncbi:MAG: hypothetical protein QM771_17455 [Nitrospira sp.]